MPYQHREVLVVCSSRGRHILCSQAGRTDWSDEGTHFKASSNARMPRRTPVCPMGRGVCMAVDAPGESCAGRETLPACRDIELARSGRPCTTPFLSKGDVNATCQFLYMVQSALSALGRVAAAAAHGDAMGTVADAAPTWYCLGFHDRQSATQIVDRIHADSLLLSEASTAS